MNKKIKKNVHKFIKQYQLKRISVDSLSEVVEKLGYTLILFDKTLNSSDVQTIINSLNLQELISCSRGFTYADSNYRLLFINENLNDEEKVLVLSHEIGHIILNHIKSGTVIGNDVKEEYEANEFAHYLLNPNLINRTKIMIACHKKTTTIVSIILMVVILTGITILIVKKYRSQYGDYYVTDSGNKYHKKECIFVKDKKNVSKLTKEDFEAGLYDACDMCLPDEINAN